MLSTFQLDNYLIDWPLCGDKEQKYYFETTHRACHPTETLARINGHRKKAGITRVADITQLDHVGIPTYISVRPNGEYADTNISVYCGKGLTKDQAKVSALMEAFERDASERRDRPSVIASYNEISSSGNVIDPNELILPNGEIYKHGQIMEWVPGRDLISGNVFYVPATAVFFPYFPRDNALWFKDFNSTNGLASGNTLGEAISHGLAEVIERDAESISQLCQHAITVDTNSFKSRLIKKLIEKFLRANIKVIIKEITSDLEIPTFFAAIDDSISENPALLCRGIGTHVNAEIAVMRALTEAAQSRCVIISGSREDLEELEEKRQWNHHELKTAMKYWYDESSPKRAFANDSVIVNKTIVDDINIMIETIKNNGLKHVIVTNLTRRDIGIPVIRVIVPGLEQTTIHSSRIGSRARLKSMQF